MEQRAANNHGVGGRNGLWSKVKVLSSPGGLGACYKNYKMVVKEVECS